MGNGTIRLAIVLAAALVLEALTRGGVIDPLTLIPPSTMATALVAILRSGEAMPDILFTFRNIALAAAIAVLGGGIAGLALHAVPRLRAALDPALATYYAIPTFVFYPLLVGLLGLNAMPLVAIGAASGVVAMIVNTLLGLDRVPRAFLKLAAANRLGPLRRAWFVTVPSAAPHLMTGVKLAFAQAVIGTVAGEFILATAGLGKSIALAYNDFDTARMYALLLLLLAAVVIANAAMGFWERHLYRRWTGR